MTEKLDNTIEIDYKATAGEPLKEDVKNRKYRNQSLSVDTCADGGCY